MTLICCESPQTRPRINCKRGGTIEVDFFLKFCHNNVASLVMVVHLKCSVSAIEIVIIKFLSV